MANRDERHCGQCGYSLVGLPDGVVCPECGSATSRGRRGGARVVIDSLVDAPMWYLVQLARGSLLLAGAVVLATVLLFYLGGYLESKFGPHIARAAWLTSAIAWWIGVYLTTKPRAKTDASGINLAREFQRLRVINRLTQVCWIGAIALAWPIEVYAAKVAAGAAGPAMTGLEFMLAFCFWARVGLTVIALFGLVPLCAQLGAIAEWAQDDDLGYRFHGAAGAIAFGGVMDLGLLILASFGGTVFFGVILRPLASLLLLGGVVVFIWSILGLARTAVWAINNAHNAQAVEDRRVQRMRRERADQDKRVRRMQTASVLTMPPAAAGAMGESTINEVVDLAEPAVSVTRVAPDGARSAEANATTPALPSSKIKRRESSVTAPRNYATGAEDRRTSERQI